MARIIDRSVAHRFWYLCLGLFFGMSIAIVPPTVAAQGQGRWRGSIDQEEGIRVVRNPAEPLFGELDLALNTNLVLGNEAVAEETFYHVWDLAIGPDGSIFVLDAGNHRVLHFDPEGRLLQAVGRRGEGPGEFQRPVGIFLDTERNLYVMGFNVLHRFDSQGQFRDRFLPPVFNHDAVARTPGEIVLIGRVTARSGWDLGVLMLDAGGAITRNVQQFPGFRDLGGGLTIMHDYSPHVRLTGLGQTGFIFAYSHEYRLYRADWSGEVELIVTREGTGERISRAEIDRIVDDFLDQGGVNWTRSDLEDAADLPDSRPVIRDLLADDCDRIYVRRLKSALDESPDETYEIFSRDGYFLYTMKVPFVLEAVHNGGCYEVRTDDETGRIRVIRHTIGNWNTIRTGR